MSKPSSGLFSGTKGARAFYGDAEAVIASRVAGLDLREHPLTRKQLGAREKKAIARKIEARTATREEYARYAWDGRLSGRRKEGVRRFWKQERARLEKGLAGTRDWSEDQVAAIVAGSIASYRGQALHAHHAFSVAKYPHLADRPEVIYPATQLEHLKGWHGGSYRKSLPSKRIRRVREF